MTVDATELVQRWSALEPHDPARHEARDAIDDLGRDAQREATRATAALVSPLDEVTRHRGDDGEIAEAFDALRRELEALDPSELDADRSWFSRAMSKVPGVGTPSQRYAQRLESARSRIATVVRSLDAGRTMLERDDVTLRADQERLQSAAVRLDRELADAVGVADALVFAVDVELPPGDERRPLFEGELLPVCRRRIAEMERMRAVIDQGLRALETTIVENRELVRAIERAGATTQSALGAAAAAGGSGSSRSEMFDDLDALDAATTGLVLDTETRLGTERSARRETRDDASVELAAIRAAFDEVDRAIVDADGRRRRPVPVAPAAEPPATSPRRQETP